MASDGLPSSWGWRRRRHAGWDVSATLVAGGTHLCLSLCLLSTCLPGGPLSALSPVLAAPSNINDKPSGGKPTSTVERCTNDQYQRCLGSLESVAKGEDITLVTSKRELHHVCRKLKRVVDCVDEHTAQCFDATLQRLFNQVVAGAKETIAEVCLPGDTQDDFLRHARCNRNVTLDEEKCAPAYRRTLELAKTVSQAQDVDHGLKRSCCAFSEFVECKNFHVERDCGDRASAFFARHMQRISGPLIEDHCGHYAHGGSCDDSGASSADRVTTAGRRWPLLLLTAAPLAATVVWSVSCRAPLNR
ncbi:uncharacterized protein LOC142575710 isoform X1 [Dermacentor variabilis]|uniref:uncharacterized protein LOC142575710 isoform X1 n=1 Tax=Dermacentor variabilis TaxID=34621 RepID=UPI003F5B5EE9